MRHRVFLVCWRLAFVLAGRKQDMQLVHAHRTSPGDDTFKCVLSGPPETGLRWSWSVPKKNCKTECKAAIWKPPAVKEKAFVDSFAPVPLSEGLCGCDVAGERKLTIQHPGSVKCDATSIAAKERCWDVYKTILKLYSYRNVWTASNQCVQCHGDQDCNAVQMPINVNADMIGKLKRLAADGDQGSADHLHKIQGYFQGVSLTSSYEWRVGSWGACSKSCADESGPGARVRTVDCVGDSDGPEVSKRPERTGTKGCQILLGEAPPASEVCGTDPCKEDSATTTSTAEEVTISTTTANTNPAPITTTATTTMPIATTSDFHATTMGTESLTWQSSSQGACRDEDGKFGTYIESWGASLPVCQAKCAELGPKCDAVDYNPVSTPTWCGVWGVDIKNEDAGNGFVFTGGESGKRVVQAVKEAGRNNMCYLKMHPDIASPPAEDMPSSVTTTMTTLSSSTTAPVSSSKEAAGVKQSHGVVCPKPLPSKGGCYFFLPESTPSSRLGCERRGFSLATSAWFLDKTVWAGKSYDSCAALLNYYDDWCGVDNIIFIFVPRGATVPYCGSYPYDGCNMCLGDSPTTTNTTAETDTLSDAASGPDAMAEAPLIKDTLSGAASDPDAKAAIPVIKDTLNTASSSSDGMAATPHVKTAIETASLGTCAGARMFPNDLVVLSGHGASGYEELEAGKDCPGNQFKDLGRIGLNACASACDEAPKCLGFSIRAHSANKAGACVLKSQGCTKATDNGWVFYAKCQHLEEDQPAS